MGTPSHFEIGDLVLAACQQVVSLMNRFLGSANRGLDFHRRRGGDRSLGSTVGCRGQCPGRIVLLLLGREQRPVALDARLADVFE